MEVRGAGGQLDVALVLALAERDGSLGQRAGDVREQAAREQDLAVTVHLGIELDRDRELAVGGAGDGLAAFGDEHDPAEGGKRGPRRKRSGRCLQAVEKRVAFGFQLHLHPLLII